MKEFDIEKNMEQYLSDVPPEEIVNKVNPGLRAMRFVLLGIFLSFVQINSHYLNLIIPFIGGLISIHGFYMLRKNKGFMVSFIGAVIRLLVLCIGIVVGATRFYCMNMKFWNGPVWIGLGILAAGVELLGLYFGMGKTRSAALLSVWYFLICIIAFWSLGEHNIIGIVMIIFFVAALISTWKQWKALDKTGYSMECTAVHISSYLWWGAATIAMITGVYCGLRFLSQYPTDWVERNISNDNKSKEIKTQLLDRGFPEKVLDAMTEEDIISLEDPLDVYTMCDGGEKGIETTVVYVEIPSEDSFRIATVSYFEYSDFSSSTGNEYIEYYYDKASESNMYRTGCISRGEITGKVFCSVEDKEYISELKDTPFQKGADDPIGSGLGNSNAETKRYAFSFLKNATDKRGYITYIADFSKETVLGEVSSLQNLRAVELINYNQQKGYIYPVTFEFQEGIDSRYQFSQGYLVKLGEEFEEEN